MAIEEEFSIEIPDKDADQIHSGTSEPTRSAAAMRSARDATPTRACEGRRRSLPERALLTASS